MLELDKSKIAIIDLGKSQMGEQLNPQGLVTRSIPSDPKC